MRQSCRALRLNIVEDLLRSPWLAFPHIAAHRSLRASPHTRSRLPPQSAISAWHLLVRPTVWSRTPILQHFQETCADNSVSSTQWKRRVPRRFGAVSIRSPWQGISARMVVFVCLFLVFFLKKRFNHFQGIRWKTRETWHHRWNLEASWKCFNWISESLVFYSQHVNHLWTIHSNHRARV